MKELINPPALLNGPNHLKGLNDLNGLNAYNVQVVLEPTLPLPSVGVGQKGIRDLESRPRGFMFRGSKEPGEQGPVGNIVCAVREMGYSGVDVAQGLNLSGAGVAKSIEKGKRIILGDEVLKGKLIS